MKEGKLGLLHSWRFMFKVQKHVDDKQHRNATLVTIVSGTE